MISVDSAACRSLTALVREKRNAIRERITQAESSMTEARTVIAFNEPHIRELQAQEARWAEIEAGITRLAE